MSILITGGAGFIGSHLANALVGAGHDVAIVDRELRSTYPLHTAVERHRMDLRTDDIRPLLDGVHTVVHLASSLGIKYGIERPWEQMDNNLTSTKRVLEACEGRRVHFIHGSSSAVYGMTGSSVPLKEDDEPVFEGLLGASGNYAQSKLLQELAVMAFSRQFGLHTRIVRFFNCIGGGQRPDLGHVVPSFIGSALSDLPLQVHNGGLQRRTFIHVSEAVSGLIRVMGSGEAGGIYNIGGTEEVRIIDLANMIVSLTGSSSPIVTVSNSDVFCAGFTEPMARVPDLGRIKSLGFLPELSLEEAITRAIHETPVQQEAST